MVNGWKIILMQNKHERQRLRDKEVENLRLGPGG
jgi:hypothetical protein